MLLISSRHTASFSATSLYFMVSVLHASLDWSEPSDPLLLPPRRQAFRRVGRPRSHFFQGYRQHVELFLPVLAIAVDPDRRGENRAGNQTAPADPTGSLLVQ